MAHPKVRCTVCGGAMREAPLSFDWPSNESWCHTDDRSFHGEGCPVGWYGNAELSRARWGKAGERCLSSGVRDRLLPVEIQRRR